MSETYLGDGLYASFDGFQIWLRAPRDGMDHEVAMDPQIMGELFSFAERMYGVKITIEQKEDKNL